MGGKLRAVLPPGNAFLTVRRSINDGGGITGRGGRRYCLTLRFLGIESSVDQQGE